MANNYSQFSEMITGLLPDEKRWVNDILTLDVEESDENVVRLKEELALEGVVDLDDWPNFCWQFDGDNDLWLYSEECCDYDHVAWFVSAFINNFRSEFIFSLTSADTCSRPRVGEFGGGWMVVSRSEIRGGNTWDAARECVEEFKKNNFGSEVDDG